MKYDIVIIGGGFFGCSLAAHLKTAKNRVLVLEKERELMTHASYNNQARVHGGYHYSRSLLTALRSRVNLADFVAEYGQAIDSTFEKYYAISKLLSKVSARHFYLFCKRIGADIDKAPAEVQKLFNPDLIEEVFTVKEFAFDAVKLRQIIYRKLEESGVEYLFEQEAESLQSTPSGIELKVKDLKSDNINVIQTTRVFNCTYSHINKLNHNSGLPLVPLKHELTEMALVDVPDELRDKGITVMDGPFFSIMPFPARGLHSLSHVRYTPHVEWHDQGGSWRNGHNYLKEHQPPTAFDKMAADAKRYLPSIGKVKYVDSLWEVKTVLPASEQDDSRPILYAHDHGGIKGYTVIMGGKIDNIRDILMEVDIAHG